VSGEGLVPDCSGCYAEAGSYEGQTAYNRCDGAYWIWYNGMGYIISNAKGQETTNFWEHIPGPLPAGDYAPLGGAEGTPNVAPA